MATSKSEPPTPKEVIVARAVNGKAAGGLRRRGTFRILSPAVYKIRSPLTYDLSTGITDTWPARDPATEVSPLAVAVVTGSSTGIGFEVALALARARHDVYATMRNPAAGTE